MRSRGETVGDAGEDQVHGADRVLDGRADHPAHAVVRDQRGSGVMARGVQGQDGTAPVQLLEQRGEGGVAQAAAEHVRGDGGARHAEVVQGPRELLQCGVHVRQGQGGEGCEAVRMGGDDGGVVVVGAAGGGAGGPSPGEVRALRGDRQDLPADARGVVHGEAGVEFAGAVTGAEAALGRGVVAAVGLQVALGPQVRVHIGPHHSSRFPSARCGGHPASSGPRRVSAL
jgi:hypothetical protein